MNSMGILFTTPSHENLQYWDVVAAAKEWKWNKTWMGKRRREDCWKHIAVNLNKWNISFNSAWFHSILKLWYIVILRKKYRLCLPACLSSNMNDVERRKYFKWFFSFVSFCSCQFNIHSYALYRKSIFWWNLDACKDDKCRFTVNKTDSKKHDEFVKFVCWKSLELRLIWILMSGIYCVSCRNILLDGMCRFWWFWKVFKIFCIICCSTKLINSWLFLILSR